MLADAVEHLHRTLSRPVVNAQSRLGGDRANDFVAEEWDVLVLLDACLVDRYVVHTPGDSVDKRVAEGPPTGRDAGGERAGAEVEETLRGLGYME